MQVFLVFSFVIQVLTLHSVQAGEVSDSLAQVTKECKSKLTTINTLKDFKEFMKHYHIVTEIVEKPKRGFLNNLAELRKCFEQKEQLSELEKLIEQQDDGVCRLDYLDKLVDYHSKYVIKISKPGKRPKLQDLAGYYPKTTYAAHIFSLFAHQVVFTCKSKLLKRVSDLESQYSCNDVLDTFLPVSLRRAKIEGENVDIGAKTLEFLDNFRQVEDFMLLSRGTTAMKSHIDVKASPEAESKISDMINLCKAREPYYSALFLPVSVLSHLGYDVSAISENPLDLNSDESKSLKCWLATAQLCQGALKVRVKIPETREDAEEFVKISFDEDQADVPESLVSANSPVSMRFKDSVDEITPSIGQLVSKKESSSPGKFKRTLKWAKKFLGLLKVDASRNEMAGHIVDSLTRGEYDLDGSVQLSGRQENPGMYTSARLVGDDADTAASIFAFTVPAPLSFIFSGCVGIAMSGVLVYFVITAATVVGAKKAMEAVGIRKAHDTDPLKSNFKARWSEEKDRQMGSLKDTVERNSMWRKAGGQVYIGNNNN